MPGYRLFLVRKNKIDGATIVYAAYDDEAVTLAYAVAEACDENAETVFELWRMGRLVATNNLTKQPMAIPVGAITERMQASLLATEEALCESRSRIARSRKLLLRRNELKAVRARKQRPTNSTTV